MDKLTRLSRLYPHLAFYVSYSSFQLQTNSDFPVAIPLRFPPCLSSFVLGNPWCWAGGK